MLKDQKNYPVIRALFPNRINGAIYLLAATILITVIFGSEIRYIGLSNKGLVTVGNSTGPIVVEVVFPIHSNDRVLAHYVEHLAWLPNIGKGSRPEDRDSNAWTNDYAVGYWLAGPPEDLSDMLKQLKVVFDAIDLPREMAETERDIVLREYDWRMANNPDAQAAEDMEAFLYEGNAIAASVIGTPDQIRSLTYGDAKAFHAETHRPEHARLVVVGDVSGRDLRAAMKAAGWWHLSQAV